MVAPAAAEALRQSLRSASVLPFSMKIPQSGVCRIRMVAQSMSTMDMALKRCARNCRNTYSFTARGQPTRISSESTAMRAKRGTCIARMRRGVHLYPIGRLSKCRFRLIGCIRMIEEGLSPPERNPKGEWAPGNESLARARWRTRYRFL